MALRSSKSSKALLTVYSRLRPSTSPLPLAFPPCRQNRNAISWDLRHAGGGHQVIAHGLESLHLPLGLLHTRFSSKQMRQKEGRGLREGQMGRW